ncbi:MAG: LacI family DNA-binding transcriptional regulator [Pseudomonadota bacterium]
MPRDRVTAMDVAARAGVSQSAVSRVFTPGGSASKETAAKVRAAADALGYRPNVLARSLITGRSRIIGLVVAYLDNQFYPDALERLSAALQKRGYHVLVFLANNRSDVSEMIDQMLDHQVDGIIAASVSLSNQLADRCEAAGIPVVLFNRGQDNWRLSEVTSDNLQGAAELAQYLVAGGHTRIAQVSGWLGSTTGRDRDRGFRDGLSSVGADLAASIDGRYARSEAASAARRLCDGPHPPEAIFCGNDHMAFAVMDALRFDLGMSIPGDVSIVGFDDVPMAAWKSYDLTTWSQPARAMVDTTVDTLMARIDDRTTHPKKHALPGRLVIRTSARGPATWPRPDKQGDSHARL